MHRALSAVVLSLACAAAHAQSVTASPSPLEFAPMTIPSESAIVPLTITNNASAPVSLSMSVAGIGFGWYLGSCSDTLAAGASCTVGVQSESWGGYPLGVYEAQFQIDTSANDFFVPLRVFAYSQDALAGLRNLSATLDSQPLHPGVQSHAGALLRQVERTVSDDRSGNDAVACPRLAQLDELLESEAASGRMSEWLAASLVVQSAAVRVALGCSG